MIQLAIIIVFPVFSLILAWSKFRADPTKRMFIGCSCVTLLVLLFWYVMAALRLEFPESLRYLQNAKTVKVAAVLMAACLTTYFVVNLNRRKNAQSVTKRLEEP